MSELKAKPTSQNPNDFLDAIAPEQKKADALALLEIFQRATGEKAMMWGSSAVGFGMYHYKSERSTQERDWPLVGFSPRKQNLTLYIMAGNKDSPMLLEKLGKHKKSGGYLYINKLSDVDQTVVAALIEKSFHYMKKTNK